jgi:carboxyl-terminal processing protease
MRRIVKTKSLVFALTGGLVILMVALVGGQLAAQDDNFYENILRFENIIKKIKQGYVEDINSKVMIDAAIKGLREVLDPHTAYFKEQEYENLMIETKGEFGGLGITISIRDSWLTVIAPLHGTPAYRMGILAGDRIIKIDGKSTKDITVDKAVQKLRGKQGTQVTIEVTREGEPEPMDYTITREIIKIPSIPYAGIIDQEYGYIQLTRFSQVSGQEVEDALKSLPDKNIKGLIFDLRHNPGGLLSQAVEVSEKFVKQNSLIVSTRGRVSVNNTVFMSTKPPAYDLNKPLIVLVDGGSASASEIVAGAIQDLDRGLVIGSRSFGKGSVQTILQMDKQHALKLTTAHYYTPSGRCINNPENEAASVRKALLNEESPELDDEEEAPDSATNTHTADSLKKGKLDVYKTVAGRKVYGGGGITPDLDVKNSYYTKLEIALSRKSMFFKFVVKEIALLKDKGVKVSPDFKVDDAILSKFRKFLEDEKFTYQSNEEIALEALEKTIQRERRDPRDTAKTITGPSDPLIDSTVAQFKRLLDKNKKEDLKHSQVFIQQELKRQFLESALGTQASIAFALTYDTVVQKAMELLKDKNRYQQVYNQTTSR